MNKVRNKILFWAALFILLGVSGCTAVSSPSSFSSPRLWLHAPGWSRGVQVGISEIADPVQITLDENDNLYLFSVNNESGVSQPQVTALDRELNQKWQLAFDIELTRPDKPQILWHAGNVHLFWLSDRSLYTAVTNPSGAIVEPPRLLSGETAVSSYDLSENAEGNLSVWYAGSRQEPGLYHLQLASENQTPTLVDPIGISPTVQTGSDGSTHLLFVQHPPGASAAELFYAVYPNGVYLAGQETRVTEVQLSTTTILEGPWIGIDRQDVYLFWTLSVRTGPEAGSVRTRYVSFLFNQPTAASPPRDIFVPQDVANLEYSPPPSGSAFNAGPRMPLRPRNYPASGNVRHLAPLKTAASEVVLAYKSPILLDFRKSAGQISLIFFRDGMPVEHQLISLTTEDSRTPAITTDSQQRLYLSWLQRSDTDGFEIYLASTAADIVEAQDKVTRSDVVQVGGDLLFGLLSGAVLAPLVVVLWGMVALVLAAVTSFLRREGDGLWVQMGVIFSYGIALVGYTAAKLSTLPGIGRTIPFEAWVPSVPVWLQTPLRLGVPVLITFVALWIAYHYVYRKGSKSSLYFIMFFAAIDGLLTAAVYGSAIYNLI